MRAIGSTFAALLLAGTAFAWTAAASPIVAGFDTNIFLANDDGTYPANGMGSGTPPGTPVAQPLGFGFNFYGTTYTSLFVNNNGNVTFNAAQAVFTPPAIVDPTGNPLLAPFFADVDTRSGPLVTFGTGLLGGQAAFGVNWLGVGYYSQNTDLTNSFQLLLVDRSDIAAGDADIYFNYGSMQWETGDASGGAGGLGGSCAHVGFNNGAGVSYEVPGSGVCGALIDGGGDELRSASNHGVPGQFLFEVRGGTIDAPEPGSLALFGAGLLGLAGLRRRERFRGGS